MESEQKIKSELMEIKVHEQRIKKIEELKETEYNPRKISKQDYNNLKKSIQNKGFCDPLIINMFPGRENIIISGHQRFRVAKELGMTEISVIELNLNETQEKAANLQFNRTRGEFEEEQLTDLLMQIESENEDMLSLTGFNTAEVNYLLGLRDREKEDIFASSIEDAYEQGNKHGIENGDVVILDKKHKIICGDSTDPNIIRKLLGENKIDLIVTSPPYNLKIGYGKYKDNQEYKEYLKMIEKVFLNLKDFLKRGRFIAVNIGREWGPINIPAKYDQIFEGIGYNFFRNIYWSKPSGSARGTITSRNPFPRYYIPKVQTEIIQLYGNDEGPEMYNAMLTYKFGEDKKRRDEKIPTILLNKYAGNVWEMMTETTLRDHPAPYPVQLPFNCIRFFTFEEERVCDPFGGSLTTILAAQQLNRIGYAIEIDPDYISFGIERYLMMFPNAKLEIIKKEVIPYETEEKMHPEQPDKEIKEEKQEE